MIESFESKSRNVHLSSAQLHFVGFHAALQPTEVILTRAPEAYVVEAILWGLISSQNTV